MPKPVKPIIGLVLNYNFLFSDQHKRGFEDAQYPHPSVVLRVSKNDNDITKVLVAPISHSPPEKDVAAVPIPPKEAQRLGLDGHRQWLKTHELNRFEWPSADLVPIRNGPNRGEYAYGLISRGVFEQARAQLLEHNRERRLSSIERDFDPRAEMEKLRQERQQGKRNALTEDYLSDRLANVGNDDEDSVSRDNEQDRGKDDGHGM